MPSLTQLKIALALLAGAAVMALVLSLNVALRRAEARAGQFAARAEVLASTVARLEDGLRAAGRVNASLRKDLKLNYQALSARERDRAALVAEKTALKAALNEVYTHDQTAKTWAAADCPGAVIERLCGPVPVPANSAGAAAGDLYAGCPRALTNGQLLAWTIELREALRLSNRDKAALRAWAGGVTADD